LNIEKIANKMEDVSDVVKTILVKYAWFRISFSF
jgi:uncharacterized protein Yka (UPF0111/DUF47 family)